jgi:hypothetical protein
MRKSKLTTNHIVANMAAGESGLTVEYACRKHGINNAIYCQWKSNYARVISI